MKIWIAGAGGGLGCALTRVLRTGETAVGTLPAPYDEAKLFLTGHEDLDITDREAAGRFVFAEGIDAVFNCAAMTDVDACEERPEEALRVNALAPGFLAEICAKKGIPLVHVSTDYVFDAPGGRPLCEWDAVNPPNVYGKSKLLGERRVLAFHPKSYVVRTAWLFGPDGENFVKTVLRLTESGAEIRMVNDQFGSPTHTEDLAYHLAVLALSSRYGLYHCAGKGVCSRYELAVRVAAAAGAGGRVIPCGSDAFANRAPRPRFSALRNLALAAAVGDRMRPWEEAADDCVRRLKGGRP